MLCLITPRQVCTGGSQVNNCVDCSPQKRTFLTIFTIEVHIHGQILLCLQSCSSKGRPKPHRITPRWIMTICICNWLYLSRMIIEILSPEACFRTLCALSELHPAQFSPLICRTWSPNRRPARDAGEFAWTNWTNIPYKRENRGKKKEKKKRKLFLKDEEQWQNT